MMEKDGLGIVMQLLRGPPLSAVLHDDEYQDKRPDFNDIVDLAKQICQVVLRSIVVCDVVW
jgi:hypothetical protein